MRRRRAPSNVGSESPTAETAEQALCRRARRHRRRGDDRRAMLMLQQAAHANEASARVWVLYGAQCVRAGRIEQAHRAFAHAAWIRERQRERAKASVTRDLVNRLRSREAA